MNSCKNCNMLILISIYGRVFFCNLGGRTYNPLQVLPFPSQSFVIGRLPNFTAMGRLTPYLRSPHGACGDNLCSLVSCRMGFSFPYSYGDVAVESLRYLPESLFANSGIIHGFPRNRPEIMAKSTSFTHQITRQITFDRIKKLEICV